MSNDDLALVQSAQAGDSLAFSKLYDKYFNKIYKFIYYKVSHRETCEDLTSLTFTKALEKLNSFKINKAHFSAWLYQIARHTVIDHYRTQKTYQDIDQQQELATNQTMDIDLDNKEKLQAVAKHLDKLPAEQKEIIIMRVWQQMSYAEISQSLNKSEASCKMSFSRGLKKLRSSILLVVLIISLLLS